MIQVYINGRNVDMASGSVSLVLRGRMFEGTKSRTWTLRAGRTAGNDAIFGAMIRAKRYTDTGSVLAGGLVLLRGEARLTGWDDAGYAFVIVSGGSAALADDGRKIKDLARAWFDGRGGYGTADTSPMWGGSIERGDMGGRWVTSDWFFGSCPSISYLIKQIRLFDANPERWPSDAWIDAQPQLATNGLYGAEPVQVGGWSGAVNTPHGRNKLPYDVVACNANVYRNGFSPTYALGTHTYLDLRGMDEYPEGSWFRLREGNEAIWLQGRTSDGTYIQGLLTDAEVGPYNDGVNILPMGSRISTQPRVAFVWEAAGVINVVQLEQLYSVCAVVGVNTGYIDKVTLLGQCIQNITPLGITPADVVEVGYVVQERPVEDVRGNDIHGSPAIASDGTAGYQTGRLPILYFSPVQRPAMAYEPIMSYGELTIGDVVRMCLHVLGLDIDGANTTEALLSPVSVLDMDTYTAEVVASQEGEGQQTSAKQPVHSADGVVLVRGGAEVEPLLLPRIYAGGYFGRKWGVPSGTPDGMARAWGTTAEAADAAQTGGKGAYLLNIGGWPTALMYSPPVFIGVKKTAVVALERGIRYIAKGRVNAAQLATLSPNGRVWLNRWGVEGVIEQYTYTDGVLEVIFWG